MLIGSQRRAFFLFDKPLKTFDTNKEGGGIQGGGDNGGVNNDLES